MNFRLSLFLFLIFVSASFAVAQDVNAPPNVCQQPFSDRFDSFSFTNAADAAERLKKFEEAVRESSEARGIIYVYGGKKSRVNEIAEIRDEIKKALKMGDSVFNAKFFIVAYGYRNTATVELFIKPLSCSQQPSYASDIEIEEVEFAEAPAESTLKKSTEEITGSLVKKTESVCPPAATAVQACNGAVKVYVIIDRKGDVIFTKPVSGHPLLQQAGGATAKNWKFRPAKIDEKTYNVAGHVLVEFRQSLREKNTVDY